MLTSVLITHVEHKLSGSVLQAFHDGTSSVAKTISPDKRGWRK
jgi:hypothetical protein